ncbi:MAG: helix-turn-helix transcriptional regulator [Candidatus Acidiferrum sp.]
MVLGDRLRGIREAKRWSLEDIEERTGLTRSYLLRVENGHSVPSMEILDKWAAALGVPVCQVFYEGIQPTVFVNLPNRLSADDVVQASLQKMIGVLAKKS